MSRATFGKQMLFNCACFELYLKNCCREVNEDNMIIRNISSEFLEDSPVLVSNS